MTDPAQLRSKMLEAFPWVSERDGEMVVGTDLDALLSASLLHHHLGWKIIGFYDFKTIHADPMVSNEQLRSAIWVDLDINQPDIRCIGHHILTLAPNENIAGHQNTLNPNLLRGISRGQFSRKYPLGTIHLLLWLLRPPLRDSADLELMLWLPDSSWINAQKYEPNVRDWLTNWLEVPLLESTVAEVQTREFEESMRAFLDGLTTRVSLPPGRGQTTSAHLGLRGFQFTFKDPSSQRDQVATLLSEIALITGWSAPALPLDWRTLLGSRTFPWPHLMDRSETVFSYASTNYNKASMTVFEDF